MVMHEPLPQTPSASAKKRVSFSPRVVSTVAYTYSKQEYDRTPIMGIFNHFCDACMQGIEGARFHCNLCENFDMCQTCFVSQGARHIHGQESFSCPELDELDEEEDEGDEGDYDFLQEYLAGLGGMDEGDEEEDTSLDGLTFRFADENDDVDTEMSSVRLADENGPLERITSQDAASLEVDEDAPIRMLFPKNAASTPAVTLKPKKVHKQKNPPPSVLPPQEKQKHNNASFLPQSIPKKPKKKKSAQPSATLPKQSAQTNPSSEQPQNGGSAKQSKHKKRKQLNAVKVPGVAGEVDEDEPLRVMLQKISTTPMSPKKSVHPETHQRVNNSPETVGLPQLDSMAKKRARATAPSPKVKKQKLTERSFG